MKRKTPESYVLQAVLDYFAAEHILAIRQNTGAVKTENRFFRFGTPGMADVLAFPKVKSTDGVHVVLMTFIIPCWVECKAPGGRQTSAQKSFQKRVEEEGHVYILAYSVDDVKARLGR